MLFHKGPLPPASADRLRTTTMAALLACALGGGMYLSGALFVRKLEHNNPSLPPQTATPMTVVNYWRAYGDDPYTRQWLLYCLAGGHLLPLAGTAALMRPVGRSLHGDARFASRREVERCELFGDEGVILGRWGRWGKFLLLPGQQGALSEAPPRSGKGAGLVQTNGMSWLGSLVVNDVRKECYRITAGWRSTFSEVHLFDPLSRTHQTARWNPLSSKYISDEPALRISDVMKLANRLSPNGASGDEFWPASCRDLFIGLGLYVIESPNLPRTIGEMMRTIMYGAADSVGDHLRRLIEARDNAGASLSATCKAMLYDFINLPPATQGSIRKTFTSRLQLWTNPLIDAATSGDSFDFRELRRKRITIYFGVEPDDLDTLGVLTNLFFSQMYGSNMDKMPENDPGLRYKLLSIEDEFTAKGKVAGFPQKVGLMGGYNIITLLIIQSASQLDSVYGHDDAKTIRKCCGATVVYAPSPNDHEYAANVSKMLGNYTARQVSHSRQAWSGKAGNVSTSLTARPLMNPTEVQLMDNDNEIVMIRGIRPILCQKGWYFRSHVFKRRRNLPLPEVEPIDIPLGRAAPNPAPVAAQAAVPVVKEARPLTPPDVSKLSRLSLTDYVGDFSTVDLPKGEPITDDDLNNAFASFQNAVQSAQEQ